jgi:hypothetical protein
MRRFAAVIVAASVVAGLVAPARADSSAAQAEALFQAGLAALTAGDWTSACARFQASQELDPSPSTAVKLARCSSRRGDLVEAWYRYQQARKLNRATREPGRRAALGGVIDEELAALEPRLAFVTVVVREAPDGLRVRAAGRVIPLGALGSPLPCNPGTIRVEASARGHEPASAEATLVEGERGTIELSLTRAPRSKARPPTHARAAPPEHSGWGPERIAGVLLGVNGLVLLGVAGGFGLAALDQVAESDPECDESDACTLRGLELRQAAERDQTRGLAFLAGGLVTLAGGLYLVIDSAVSVSVVPTGNGGAIFGHF